MTAPRFRQVFVLGVARGGSTLVGRVLDLHPRVVCVGEVARVDLALKHAKPCSCGRPLAECPFWKEGLPILARAGNRYRRFTPRVYEELRALAGAEILVDTSKTRVWRMTHGLVAPLRGARAGYVLVVRDPRGVMASHVRRWKKSFASRLASYEKWMRRQVRFCEKLGERAHVVQYEALCARPEAELRRLCAFLGVDYAPRMLAPAGHEHHMLHSSSSAYLRGSGRIEADERWRSELDPAQIAAVERAMRRIPLVRELYVEARDRAAPPAGSATAVD